MRRQERRIPPRFGAAFAKNAGLRRANERVNLPRETRRRLRAIEHRLAAGRPATMSLEQLAGWKAFEAMVAASNRVGE